MIAVKDIRFMGARPCACNFSSQLFVVCNKIRGIQGIACCFGEYLRLAIVCDLSKAVILFESLGLRHMVDAPSLSYSADIP